MSVGGAPDSRRLAVTVVNPTSEISTIPITDAIESFDVSPDGKTILFDRVRQNADMLHDRPDKPPPSRH